MEILENVKMKGSNKPEVIIMISYKEAEIFHDAMEAYVKANKRKKIAKKLYKQIYDTLPF